MRLVLVAGVAALGLEACAHTVTNEERLDGMTDVTVNSTEEAAEMRCREASPEVQLARDRTQRKSERLARYSAAIADAKSTQAHFDDAFKKEPDLVYGPQSAEWKRKMQGCTDLIAALTKEQGQVEREVDSTPPPPAAPAPAPAPAPTPVAAEKEKPAPAPTKKAEKADEKAAVADSAADEAFEDDADELRSAYKKKAKVAKAKAKKSKKSKKRKAELANR